MLCWEALTCRLPSAGGLWGLTPRKGGSLPALPPSSVCWGLSEKFLRDTTRIWEGCRKRCLTHSSWEGYQQPTGCAAPDELRWRKVWGIPIWRAWTEAERLKDGRQDTETEKEHTHLSPTICWVFVPPCTPQLRCLLPGAAVTSPALCSVGKEQWVSSISHSIPPKAETSTLMEPDTPVKSKRKVPCRETLG